MRYFGGKVRISKPLSLFLNTKLNRKQPFVDMFCGSCNVISKIDSDRVRVANDAHYYLISLWNYVMSGGKLPDSITREEYHIIKEQGEDWLKGFVGFGCSFAGKWWGGYASGEKGRNYCANAKNSISRKAKCLHNVIFTNYDYKECPVPEQSLIYCDIPYKGATSYCKKLTGEFNHDEFYSWCKDMEYKGHSVYVSEYAQNVPDGASVVWSVSSKKDIRNSAGRQDATEEVVFRFV